MRRSFFLLSASVCLVAVGLSQVDTAWVRTWRGPNGDAAVRLVGVSPAGDVYAAGYTMGAADSADYAVLKYDSDGVFQWAKTYNGPGSGKDYVTDLAVDDAGNCYVTGESPGTGTGDDYATIKYLPNGDTAWVRRYAGPVEGEQADGVCVDRDGNVYVTGYSVGQGTASDLVTIKYDSNGNQQWLHRYDGEGFIDWGHDIAVDDSGYVYVAGDKGKGFFDFDAFVIKYSPAGDTLWTWSCPNDLGSDGLDRIDLDPEGNVVAFGSYSVVVGRSDFFAVKLAPDGDTVWARQYPGPIEFRYWDTDMAVDDAGNVYATGGQQDSAGNYEYFSAAYHASGEPGWTSIWGRDSFDLAWGIATGDSGYVYVTGSSDIASWLADVVTLKLDAQTGRVLWQSLYDGPAHGSDACLDIAVGPDKLPVAVGSTSDSTGTSALLIKYTRMPGVAERGGRFPGTPRLLQTIVRAPELAGIDCRVVDVLGRDVTGRRAYLAPGVYYLESTEEVERRPTTKVLLTR